MENSKEEMVVFNQEQFFAEVAEHSSLSKKIMVLNRALDQEPFMKKNMNDELRKSGGKPSSATDYDYIPIEIVEEALRKIFFRQIDFTIRNQYRELNSFIVIARISYIDPVTQQKRKIDGIGATALQQDSGKKIEVFNTTLKKNALELGVGIAYSRAIKNAAKKLGKAFGANLNRDEEIERVKVFTKSNEDKMLFELTKLFTEKSNKLKPDHIERIREIINTKEEESYGKAIIDLRSVK